MKKFTREEIEKKVNELLVDKLRTDESEIRSDDKFDDDLGADSLDAVEKVMEFEKEFCFDLSAGDMYALVQYTVVVERKCKQS